ncbi:aminotransferase class I/II-fold pyridoxal phosphate-dependent enzyme [Ureibacillus acetophenoni]
MQTCTNAYYNVNLNPHTEVAILGGAKIGLVQFPMAILNPGDYVLLPDPGYPDFLSGSRFRRCTLRYNAITKRELLFTSCYNSLSGSSD